MDKHWLDLRWPITVLLLGAMGFVLLARSSKHPIQLRLQVNFDNPLAVGGTMQHELLMQQPVQVRMTETAPIQLKMSHPKPIRVEVSEKKPMQVRVGEDQPMEVQVKPEGSVKVRLGL